MTSEPLFVGKRPHMNIHMAWQLACFAIIAALINRYGSRDAQAFAMVMLILQWINWGIEWRKKDDKN